MTQEVLKETDRLSGIVVEEKHLLNGRLHRDPKEGPAYVRRNRHNGTVTRETYYFEGHRHREDGPAEIHRRPENGVVLFEQYCRHGRKHREDGPAVTHREANGAMILQYYCRKGYVQRDSREGPAHLRADPITGVITNEIYWEKDPARPTERSQFHRIGGPAWIERHSETGLVLREDYYVMGELHRPREEGPALIHRDAKTGEVTKQEFYEKGVKIEMPEPGRPAKRPGPPGGNSTPEGSS